MDALDKYKKAWDNQPEETGKVSKLEIYKMTKLKSSSVVKWIFFVGLLEFILLATTYLFIDYDEYERVYSEIGLEKFLVFSHIITFTIITYFLYKFYLNYRRISVTADTKSLMNQILRTRKTVKQYIITAMIFSGISAIVMTYKMLSDKFSSMSNTELVIIIILIIICLGILLGILWLFYQLLYGILLRKLKRNYKELAKLDS